MYFCDRLLYDSNMWKENLYQPVEILIRNHEIFPIAEHQHSFFEMVYVKSGTGQFYTKESDYKVQELEYKPQTLIVVPPETTHCFTINTHSEYIFIRFTTNYIESYIGKNIANAFCTSSYKAEIELCEQDMNTVSCLFNIIQQEVEHKGDCSNYLQQQWLNSILVLVARNIIHNTFSSELFSDESNGAMYMLQYIQQHIHQPELLNTEALSKIFNLSQNYIGHYFKRNFQETLQQYVTRNRIKMVENLLLNSNMTIKEITYNMGYADSCHLVKSFQKFYGTSPLKYRKKYSKNHI